MAAAGALGAGLAGLPDSKRIGAVPLNRGGRILEANASTLEILRCGDALIDRDGILKARLPADRSRLQKLLSRAPPDWRGDAPSGRLDDGSAPFRALAAGAGARGQPGAACAHRPRVRQGGAGPRGHGDASTPRG